MKTPLSLLKEFDTDFKDDNALVAQSTVWQDLGNLAKVIGFSVLMFGALAALLVQHFA